MQQRGSREQRHARVERVKRGRIRTYNPTRIQVRSCINPASPVFDKLKPERARQSLLESMAAAPFWNEPLAEKGKHCPLILKPRWLQSVWRLPRQRMSSRSSAFRNSLGEAQQNVFDEAARLSSISKPHPEVTSARIADVTNKDAGAAPQGKGSDDASIAATGSWMPKMPPRLRQRQMMLQEMLRKPPW